MEKTAEQKNQSLKINLLEAILKAKENLFYHLVFRGGEIRELMSRAKFDEKEKSYTLTQSDFNKVLEITAIVKDKSRWDELGSLAPDSLKEIKIKQEILEQL